MHSLVEAILADPEDDAPRLVYADALMQAGDPRGELIAVQCALARCDASDPAREALAERSAALERAHRDAWLGGLGLSTQTMRFERGFVEELTAPFSVATGSAAAIVARHPLLRRLNLSLHGQRDRVALARSGRSELLARATHLRVRGKHIGNTRLFHGPIADVNGLRGVPFTSLTSLRFERVRLDPAMLGDVLSTSAFAGLDELALPWLHLDADDIAVVAARPASERVTRIVLDGNRFGDEGVERLVRSPVFAHVFELGLRVTGVTRDGLRALAAMAPPSLRRVDLVDTGVDEAAVEEVRPPFEVNLSREAPRM